MPIKHNANKQYNQEWKAEHYARLNVWVTKEEKRKWTAEAAAQGKSLAQYIRDKMNG